MRGSRAIYDRLLSPDETGERDELDEREIAFIRERDSFYLSSVSETGWPYVQHRGGERGFIHCLDNRTIGWAEYVGNRQYVSLGNVSGDDRVAMILMDYPNRRRLKLLGRMRIVEVAEQPGLTAKLSNDPQGPPAQQLLLVAIEAVDWNCPKYITPRFTLADVEAQLAPLKARIAELEAQSKSDRAAGANGGSADGR
jgi:predicted pyridoxine 5'-phosphate oxidase superfamily flavin-nucleotide-binding protein